MMPESSKIIKLYLVKEFGEKSVKEFEEKIQQTRKQMMDYIEKHKGDIFIFFCCIVFLSKLVTLLFENQA
jgi:hypothetical protein